jgi:SHS2 domain-containing protein
VFREALHALAELIGDDARGEIVSCQLVISGSEPAVLLVQRLDELVYRAETEDLVPDDAERVELGEQGLRATVRCHRGHPQHIVKGTTYHRLGFEPSGGGFHATVVLDV